MRTLLSLASGAVPVAFLGLAGLSVGARADVTLAPLFTDHMVLQQRSECPVWGWERPGVKVTVRASWGATAEATADARGRWQAMLTTAGPGGPYEVAVAGDTGVTLRDVYVGEVWLVSGQSNMEWPLSATDHAAEDIAGANRPDIRFFTVPNVISLHPRIDADAQWRVVSPEMAGGISAVGYHFARQLAELDPRLGMPAPVGIIAADWGGTRIEAWMDAESLAGWPEYAGELATIETLKDPVLREPLMADAAMSWWDRLDTLPGQPGNGWTGLEFDDSGWGEMELPASWTGDLASFDGMVRFRRDVELPRSWAGKPAVLELGPIDDRDDAWINGVRVGGTRTDGAWQVARRYEVPAGVLRAGRNVVSVRAYDTGGLGGINGRPEQMRLTLAGIANERPAEEFAPRMLAGEWRFQKGTAAAQLPPQNQPVQVNANTATALYNGMINPLAPYKVRGVLWYQGESNRGNAGRYAGLMRSWIGLWRERFGDPALPFLWVQIAPYGYANDRGETAALREAQAAATDVAHTGMVVTTDIGDNADIHPRNKREVGRRLALMALRDVYGLSDLVASGPTVVSAHQAGSGVMQVNMASAEGMRLVPGPGGLTGFEIAGADRRFHAAQAEVVGGSISVMSPEVRVGVAVRFNWSRSPEANLFNAQGLPAAPFRTDDWAAETVTRDESSFLAPLRSREAGFVDLFNGTDLAGWEFVNSGEATWRVASDADGAFIRCSGVPTGVMRTARQYENFVLEMEYRHMVPGGNAGLFVWSDPIPVRGAPFTRSVEVQVMDGQEGNGFTSDGDIFPIWGAVMTPENGRGGSRAFPTERRSNPAPMWNHYRVECVDGRITLALNGKVVTRGHSISPRRGYICLESEGTEVHFRNLRIKELPASSPGLAAEHVGAVAQGFRTLYNGVDFSGWDFKPEHEGHWRAQDWRIGFDGQGADLWTTESFGDFELICDWRWTGAGVETERPVILPDGSVKTDAAGNQVMQRVMDAGDSGIYLRGSSKSQVNMWCWPIGSGEVYGYRTDGSMPADVRAGVTPRVVADAPIGQWNRFHITMRGERLTVVLNGQTVLEGARLPGVASEGPIALQMHGNPIEFANIYIRPLR